RPGVAAAGLKVRTRDPIAAPETSARPISLAAWTAVRCWRSRPGFSRPARIRSIVKGIPVTRERPNAVRRICPPPSPIDPSRFSTEVSETAPESLDVGLSLGHAHLSRHRDRELVDVVGG